MRVATVGYIPPPHFKGAKSFLENYSRNKPASEVILYSDHNEYGFRGILNPENIAGRHDNKWAMNNAIFCMGLRFALQAGVTHMLYVESDCRFGCPGWDAIIFEEYFNLKFPPVAAGSLVAHSCVNGGGAFYERFYDFIGRNRRSGEFAIPIYGIPNAVPNQFPAQSPNITPPGSPDKRFKPAVYPNGALGVYDTLWLAEIFGLKPDGTFKDGHSMMTVTSMLAWDHEIGMALYDRFGVQMFDVIAHMNSMFSSYGDRLTTEAERLQLLRDKKATAVHQVKSEIVS